MCACFGGAIRMVKAMLRIEDVKKKKGKKVRKKLTDINVKDPIGWTPLLIAVDRCKMDCIEYLLRKDADVELRLDLGKQTCLHIAAQRCELPSTYEVMEMLITFGANPGALNEKKQNVIDICKFYGKAGEPMVKLIEEALMDASVRQYRVNTMIEDEVNEDDVEAELSLLEEDDYNDEDI
jgi:ankyrin repeat protein